MNSIKCQICRCFPADKSWRQIKLCCCFIAPQTPRWCQTQSHFIYDLTIDIESHPARDSLDNHVLFETFFSFLIFNCKARQISSTIKQFEEKKAPSDNRSTKAFMNIKKNQKQFPIDWFCSMKHQKAERRKKKRWNQTWRGRLKSLARWKWENRGVKMNYEVYVCIASCIDFSSVISEGSKVRH